MHPQGCWHVQSRKKTLLVLNLCLEVRVKIKDYKITQIYEEITFLFLDKGIVST